jgi:NADH-quinone oxidoreductase subunit J
MVVFALDWIAVGFLFFGLIGFLRVKQWMQIAFLFFAVLMVLACFFVRLSAPWVGLTHLIIYVGGVLILQLFGMMITHRSLGVQPVRLQSSWFGLVVSLALLLFGWHAVDQADFSWISNTKDVNYSLDSAGQLILGSWLVIFELLSLFLLFALIGAVFVVRQITNER